MADINAYALGLELQLQADKAFQTLEKFKQQLTGVEQALKTTPVSFAMPNAAAHTAATKQMSIGVLGVDAAYNKVLDVANSFNKTLGTLNEGIGFLNKKSLDQVKRFKDMHAELTPLVRELRGMDLQGIFGDKQDLDRVQKFVDNFESSGRAIDQAVDESQRFTGAIRALAGMFDHAGEHGQFMNKAIITYLEHTSLAAVGIGFLVKGFVDLIHMQEAYANVTMRAVGSQAELIKKTNDLRVSLGATAKESVETFTSLAGAGFRASDALDELARTNYMFSQATGVGAGKTAEFQRAVATTGNNASQTTKFVSEMSAVIRNSGMSAEQAAGMINKLTGALRPLRFLYGDEQAMAGTKAIAQFAGAVRAAGGDAEAFQQDMLAMARSPEQMIVSFGVMGVKGKRSLENLPGFFAASAEKLAKMQEKADGAGRALTSEAWAKMSGMSLETAASMVSLWHAADDNIDKFKELANAQTANADLEADFSETLKTLTKTLKQFLEPLISLASVILDAVVPALTVVLKPLEWLGKAIAGITNFFGNIPVLGQLFKAALGAGLIVMIVTVLREWRSFNNAIKKTVDLVANSKKNFKEFFATVRSGMLPETMANNIKGLDGGFKGLKDKFAAGSVSIKQFNFNSLKSIGGIQAALAGVGGKMGVYVKGLKEVGAVAAESAPSIASAASGLFGMSGGALSAATNLAKLHPIIAIVVAAVAGAFIIVPKLFEMFDKGGAAVKLLSVALMGVMWPLTSLYVTFKAVWAVLKGVWEAVSDLLDDAFKPLAELFKPVSDSMSKIGGITGALSKALGWLTNSTKAVIKAFSPLAMIFKVLGLAIKGIVGLINAITSPIDSLKRGWQGAAEFIAETWVKATATVRNTWSMTINAMIHPLDTLKRAWAKASDVIGETWKKATDKMKILWSEFTGLFDKTEKKANSATAAAQHHMSARMQNAAEHLKTMQAHRAVTNFGTALHAITRPEVTRAVDRVYSKADAISQPIIKNNAARITPQADQHSAKIVYALRAVHDAIKATTTKDGTQSLGNIEDLIKQYFPQFADKKERGGLGTTAANGWM